MPEMVLGPRVKVEPASLLRETVDKDANVKPESVDESDAVEVLTVLEKDTTLDTEVIDEEVEVRDVLDT